MNGRVYLPEIGRFLSPDPFVQFPESTQNYNRYVYVGNNPLSATDPSGYFLKKLLGVVGFALNFVPGMQALSPFVRGFLTGMVGSGGNLKAGLLGGIGAAAFGGLHGMEKGIGKVVAHGMVGGALSVAGGGRFGDGFLGAATAQAFSGVIDGIGRNSDGSLNMSGQARAARAVAAAVAGGTASKLAGGKFATGAITGAFSRMFNDDLESRGARKSHEAPAQGHDQADSNGDEWQLRGTLAAPGDRITIDAGRELRVEIGTNAFGIDGAHVLVSADALSADGTLIPSARPVGPTGRADADWNVGGHVTSLGNVNRVLDTGANSPGGYRWTVTIPRQPGAHGTTSIYVNVYSRGR